MRGYSGCPKCMEPNSFTCLLPGMDSIPFTYGRRAGARLAGDFRRIGSGIARGSVDGGVGSVIPDASGTSFGLWHRTSDAAVRCRASTRRTCVVILITVPVITRQTAVVWSGLIVEGRGNCLIQRFTIPFSSNGPSPASFSAVLLVRSKSGCSSTTSCISGPRLRRV